jgi:hypothetical protein
MIRPKKKPETIDQRYERLSSELAEYEEMVGDAAKDEVGATTVDKMLRRYRNTSRKVVEYARDKHPRYQSLLKQAKAIEAMWDKQGKHINKSAD